MISVNSNMFLLRLKKVIKNDDLISKADDKSSSETNVEAFKFKLLNEEIKILDETNKNF